MYTKGSAFIILGLATLADRTTPGALQPGSGITFVADQADLVSIEQIDSTSAKVTFLDNGTVSIVGTAVNADGNAITSSQPSVQTATDESALDIVLTVTAVPTTPSGDQGGGG